MNDENELAGFCFKSTAKTPQPNSLNLQPERNPFPFLIPSNDLGCPTTQPLIHAVFLPSDTLYQRKPQDRADLDNRFNFLHELMHLWFLSRTPAKEVAKTPLVFDYTHISLLMLEKSSSKLEDLAQGLVNNFKRSFSLLNESLVFVEELLATSFAFEFLERDLASGALWEGVGFQEPLEELKEEVLQNEEKYFPGYREIFNLFQPITRLILDDMDFFFIIPLLQRVELEMDQQKAAGFTVPDARKSLAQILRIMMYASEDGEAVANELQSLYQEVSIAWKMLIDKLSRFTVLAGEGAEGKLWRGEGKPVSSPGTLMDLEPLRSYAFADNDLYSIGDISSAFYNALHQISYPEIKSAIYTRNFADRAMLRFRYPVPLDDLKFMILEVGSFRNQSYIDMNWINGVNMSEKRRHIIDTRFSDPDTLCNIHIDLLFYEGLRQQILKRIGIICPFNLRTKQCQCNNEARKSLLRLSHLAVDGLFGKGDWFLLPCRR